MNLPRVFFWLSEMSHLALVDDDDAVRKALARLLRAHDLEVRTYASPSEFLDALPENTPSCVIIDFHMPESTGVDLQRELLRRGMRVPTIVLTARDSIRQREECRMLGAAAFLTKPVAPNELLGAITSARGAPAPRSDRTADRVNSSSA